MENYQLPGDKETIAGLFSDKASAEKAYFILKNQGYHAGEINVLMSKETQIQYYSDDITTKKSFNNLDSFKGGIADDFSSFGTNLKIPWPGLVVSGPMESEFNIYDSNGSLTIMEAVLKSGIPKDEAVRFIEGLKNGNILITVYSHHFKKLACLTENHENYLMAKAV